MSVALTSRRRTGFAPRLLRRVLYSLIALWALLTIVFVMGHLIGDPTRLMLDEGVSEQTRQALRDRLGLNDPLWAQYWRALTGWFSGDMGQSFRLGVDTLPLALSRLPMTLLLVGVTVVIAYVVGTFFSVLSAMKPGYWADRLLAGFSLFAVSVSDFWIGLMLILLFSAQLGLFPSSGFVGAISLVLPVLTLLAKPLGRIQQVSRASMVDELRKSYAVTARSRGLARFGVLTRHVYRNTSAPVLTISTDEFTGMITGAVMVEYVFALPGIGSLLIDAVFARDLPLVETCIVVLGIFVIAVNLILDIGLSMLDPRIRES